MRYSVLLPTRNGGPYLRNCIESILADARADIELVISDNANTDETPRIIADFADDPRVKTLRLASPVSVTDNWNNALNACSGDYILMMGDDDYLLPDYFTKMDAIIDRWDQPDCVVYNAYSYVAPSAISDETRSFYNEAHFQFDGDLAREGLIDGPRRLAMARDAFRFRLRIPLNMQTTLISRRVLPLVRGGFFQPPFPDHYALNALLISADRWVISPERLLVVGVSPKSFGHFVYSNQQAGGMAYLGIASDFPGRLPGSELVNGMHVWLEMLSRNYADQLGGLRIDRAAYVRRQVYAWIMQCRAGGHALGPLLRNLGLLSARDWAGLASSVVDPASWQRVGRMAGSARRTEEERMWHGLRPLEGVADIRQFARWLDHRDCSPA